MVEDTYTFCVALLSHPDYMESHHFIACPGIVYILSGFMENMSSAVQVLSKSFLGSRQIGFKSKENTKNFVDKNKISRTNCAEILLKLS